MPDFRTCPDLTFPGLVSVSIHKMRDKAESTVQFIDLNSFIAAC